MKPTTSLRVVCAVLCLVGIACGTESEPGAQPEGNALTSDKSGAQLTYAKYGRNGRRRDAGTPSGTLDAGTPTVADAGQLDAAAGSLDAGTPAVIDAGTVADAGTPAAVDAGAVADAGTVADSGAGSGGSAGSGTVEGAAFPGGFLEPTTSTEVRARLTRAQLQTLLPPAGGKFVFPAPYGTEAIRLTDAGSCGGSGDCVRYLGYSYWRNINNHVGQDSMLIVLGLDANRGGAGFSLFRYYKNTDELESLGPVFAGTNIETNRTGEGIYFSGTRPTTIYVAQGTQLLRFEVMGRTSQVVFDVALTYGAGTYLWQHHSSDDDVVHSATLRVTNTGAVLGCLVYREDTAAFRLFAAGSGFDECQVDRSGDWLVIKDNIDGRNGEDNRIINLDTLVETNLLDEQGAAGHSDLGHGVLVAEDNWNSLPGAVRAWRLGQSPLVGPIVYHDPAWRTEGSSHISHTNARPGVALEDEVVCQSTVARSAVTRGSEIFCYRLDGSRQVMVVAPVMTDLNAAGGGDDYAKAPKGNLDVTGRYFIWTSNAAGDRLDAFLVKVPSLLGGAPTPTPTPTPEPTPTPTPTPAPMTGAVQWTSLVNVTASGTALTKTSGCDGCPDAGAISQQQIAAGDGFVEFTASETSPLRVIGLSNGNQGTSIAEIDFGMRLQGGTAEVRESGVYKADTSFNAGDVLRIAVAGGAVNYSKNGSVFFTSAAPPAYPLIVDSSFSNLNSTITNAVMSSGTP